MTADDRAAYSTVVLVVFVVAVVIGAIRTYVRAISYTSKGLPIELILKRDLMFMTGVTIPIVLIFYARASGQSDRLMFEWWYNFATSIPFLFAFLVYAYYEMFVIDRREVEDTLTRMERKIDETMKVSTNAFHEANTVNLKIEDTNKNIERALAASDSREARAESDRADAKEERRQYRVDDAAAAEREGLRQEGRDEETTAEAHRQEGRDELTNGDGPSLRDVVDVTRREVGDLHQNLVDGQLVSEPEPGAGSSERAP